MTHLAPRGERGERGERGKREVEFRACCGRLRFALLDAVESLPAGMRVAALRWGPAEIAVDVEVGAGRAEPAVDAILAAVRAQLGAGAFCYAGRGTLVTRREAR